MPRLLVFRLLPEDLALFRQFECGDAPWAQEVAEWIRGEGAETVRTALGDPLSQVWFYTTGAGEVVGFSSLGRTRWRYPDRRQPPVALSLIPMLGVHARFQRQPADEPKEERYSRQILRHVIGEAKQHSDTGDRQPLLGLYVHPVCMQVH